MIVCVCRRVSDHQIRRAAADGAVSLECLQLELGLALQCGSCADCALRVLGDAQAGRGEAGTGDVVCVRRPLAEQHA